MMIRRILVYVMLVACGILACQAGFAQGGRTSGMDIPFRKPGSDSVKVVKILNANTFHSEKRDTIDLSYWVGDVRIQQEKTLIYCDSMIMNPSANIIEAFGHVHINDNDSTNIYSEYMKYQVDVRTIHFLRAVKLTDGKGVLTTEELQYDLNQRVGTYDHGGKIVNNGSVLTSQEGTYYEDTKDVHFHKNVVLVDKQYDLTADSLLYNTQTQVSTFITETFIKFKDSTNRTVRTSSGYYDLKNKKAEFGRRPIITDGGQRIIGDSVRFDDSTGISVVIGRGVYTDTVEHTVLIGNYMISNQKTKSFLATGHPLMIIKQDKDSIYLTADTLFSGRLMDAPHIKRRLFLQDSLHKAYIDSIQKASSDSLHNAALKARSPQDTLLAVTDTSNHQVMIDRSDSLIRRKPDSLMKADSLGKIEGLARKDSLTRVDSLTAATKITDSLARITKMADSVAHAKGGKGKPQPIRRPPGGKPAGGPGGAPRPNNMKPPSEALAGEPGKEEPPKPVVPDRDRLSYVDTSSAPITDTTLRYILGYHHVRIYSDSLQAVSDSLYYSTQDSVFRLFINPIAWGNGNYQITGDTMYVYTKNKKAQRLYVFENGLAINKIGKNFYNQIKGTTINTYFKGGEVDYMRAKGNAECVYYMQDDNKGYTGVNKSHSDIIDMIFDQKTDSLGRPDTTGRELRRVAFRSDVEGSVIPIKKVNFEEMRLRGFKWQESRRPKTKFELFEDLPVAKPATDSTLSVDSLRKIADSVIKDSAAGKKIQVIKAGLIKAGKNGLMPVDKSSGININDVKPAATRLDSAIKTLPNTLRKP